MVAIRHRSSWVSTISRFSKAPKGVKAVNGGKDKVVMIESENDNDMNPEDSTIIKDLKHYSRTSDMSDRMKQKMITSILEKLAYSETALTRDAVQAIDQAVTYLYRQNGGSIKGTISEKQLVQIFNKSAAYIVCLKRLWIPNYMSLMMKSFVDGTTSSPRVISYMAVLGSMAHNGSLEIALSTLSKRVSITTAVVDDLVILYDGLDRLNLGFYESVLTSLNEVDLGDYFFDQLINHVESLYSTTVPLIHEYLDQERSLDRVMMILGRITPQHIESMSFGCVVRLFTLAKDMEEALDGKQPSLSELIMTHLESKASLDSSELKDIIFSVPDEPLICNLLLSSYVNHPRLFNLLVNQIESNSSKYSPETLIQSKILSASLFNEAELVGYTKNIIEETATYLPIDETKLYEKLIQIVLVRLDISSTGTFVNTISDYMRSRGAHISLKTYKNLIDRALKDGDVETAIHVFEDSLEDSVNWTEDLLPSVLKTLNNIIIGATEVESGSSNVEESFRIFLKVKQQMSTTPVNINAMCAMADRMLESECVGDLIEMMKREFPKIDKNALQRLPLDKPWGIKYRQFFDKLQSYVITYTNESTFETNWVLYGELHKYFNAPFESYLPTMKFFCEKDRLNAALIIFRQIKRLNELHGDHSFPPPLREMYMYLFQVFGDKLYEEGVDELHSYMKMDVSLPKLDIELQNCILNAYSNLQEVAKARDLFLTIVSGSTNGKISLETATIMIKTFTYSDLVYVKKFWNNLSLYGVTPDYSIFRQYLIAHVYNGHVEEACKLVKEMDDYGLELSSDTLLALHNYCLEDYHQKQVIKWAEKYHKQLWIQAVDSGLLRTADNYVPDRQLLQ
ncbi:uncharacterized protein KQ657_001333 [Scheffersomyces spartinae]|uniref:Mitochondrial 15S rRNA processing factor CCM1 n=1 Tax=Scheffersomyces spartinae TaxID=45513 RepID=A0A9P7V8N9_9ASCO|nr:uncharacterized protein KQ657_001333 [Scheffersomyces spartinae]KAG7192876.1 hypothetical protein KQ657_001333 [Scheffersomyces spartinae]